jgi:hypothetical protein
MKLHALVSQCQLVQVDVQAHEAIKARGVVAQWMEFDRLDLAALIAGGPGHSVHWHPFGVPPVLCLLCSVLCSPPLEQAALLHAAILHNWYEAGTATQSQLCA